MKDSIEILQAIASAAAVARARSFRGAMRSTNSGYRTLQQRIHFLEKTLGFPIFHASPDGMVPTREGLLVLAEATKLDSIVANVRRFGRTFDNETKGEVLLATTEGLGTFWISPQLAAFNRTHPGIAIKLNPSMALVDLTRFDVDLALQVVEPTLPMIKRVKLGKLHLMLAASQSYIQLHGEPKNMADLAKHTFVFLMSPQASDRHIIEKAVGGELSQSQTMVMPNSAAHYFTIEKGLGIGFLPSYIFGVGTKVVPLSIPLRYEIDIWLCFHDDARRTPRIARVIDWLNCVFDPRLFPWFRREFVPPKNFAALIESTGARAIIDDILLPR